LSPEAAGTSPPPPDAPNAKRNLPGRRALLLGVVLLVVVLIVIVVSVTGNKKAASPTTGKAGTSTTLPHQGNSAPSTATSTTTTSKTAVTTSLPTSSPTTSTSATSPPTTKPHVGLDGHFCTATMTNSKPGDTAQDTVIVSSNVPEAPVKITKKYETTTSIDTAYTSSSGSATLTFGVGSPAPYFTVQVKVDVGNGVATCSTSFTPQ
jgi:hypothetical protein